MTTLIAVYTTGGCQGRCDARCYLATGEECACVCGGANHGAGGERAEANTRQLAQAWADRARADGQPITHTELATTAACTPLFGLAELRAGKEDP
jgi:hypothetical protein